ncbi:MULTISPECIES: hypothetical protein [unclassified Dolichospermum]|jgi:hypothetical protein|uniref:hypothetical protein n=1 Tax=unclassified Dolichospermum TaxID=2622029 RepID=UPI0014466384|nr:MULTISPECIES: hypothetical protein [unclassified Dolichospermum]MTJ16376.1 hypothetical protein [Dolichospermum sp. UHCC 0299]MTJ41706.1 hypothetical protein [Dolichospermum sp. UHCC 0406]
MTTAFVKRTGINPLKSIELTVEQLNILFNEPRITGVVDISDSGKLIVSCEDGLARMIGFSDNEIIWFDSYSEQD